MGPIDQVELRRVTYEEQESARAERLAEVGTGPPCPFCGVPRVQRSDYLRCNREGINWLSGEDLSRNPKAERWERFMATASAQSTRSTYGSRVATGSTVPTAGDITK